MSLLVLSSLPVSRSAWTSSSFQPSCSWKRNYLEHNIFDAKCWLFYKIEERETSAFVGTKKMFIIEKRSEWNESVFPQPKIFALAPSDTFFITHVFQWDDSESRATCLYEGVRAFVFGSERERDSRLCVCTCVCEMWIWYLWIEREYSMKHLRKK